ncbi:hypothetical protein D3C85_1115750 [compost metagenome]
MTIPLKDKFGRITTTNDRGCLGVRRKLHGNPSRAMCKHRQGRIANRPIPYDSSSFCEHFTVRFYRRITDIKRQFTLFNIVHGYDTALVLACKISINRYVSGQHNKFIKMIRPHFVGCLGIDSIKHVRLI